MTFRFGSSSAGRTLAPIIRRLPALQGAPIRVWFKPHLTVSNGKLLSRSKSGKEVHAGSHMRKRQMVLDSELLGNKSELARIFSHEVAHFIWLRLGNARRRVFEDLIRNEILAGAGGELGWSAELVKRKLSAADRRHRSRLWREYLCESFCDSVAGTYSGVRRHREFTLAKGRRGLRARLLQDLLGDRLVSI